ncbi:MAG: efflux RND transporter periplasmic adaptor subunit [Acidobacteriota bacterium]
MRLYWVSPLPVALALTLGCSGPPPERAAASLVKTAWPTVRRVEITLPLIGRVEQARGIRMVALVEGRVSRVEVADGAAVKAGEEIFRLDGSRVEARRRALESAVQTAGAERAAARNRARQASRRADEHLARPGEVASAQAEVAAAEQGAVAAETALARFASALKIAAPVAGRFVGRVVSQGQNVRPGDLLGEILEPHSTRVTAEVVPDTGRVPRPGESATVNGGEAGSIAARVTAIQPSAGGAGTVRLWLEGRDLSSLVLGTVVRGHVVVGVHEEAVTVPETAVVRDDQDRPFLFVGRTEPYEKRQVATGRSGSGWIEIMSGLWPGEPVVVEGAYELYWSGCAVKGSLFQQVEVLPR